ncbi:MAG: DUF3147 family protein [Candidatus Acidiferrum sp.]
MMVLLFRFLAGGLLVSVFAIIGDVLKPKSFAGLFGAAPSIALATLTLTIVTDGRLYAAKESRSMLIGAAAFSLYACLCIQLLVRCQWSATRSAVVSLVLWFACAFAMWFVFLE